MEQNGLSALINEIKDITQSSRGKIAQQINETILHTYWKIGRVIVEREQEGNLKSQYGKKLLPELSKRLASELGRGYSHSNLQNMRQLFIAYPEICQMPSGKLTWSHFNELSYIKDADARSFYEHECINSGWSVEELKRQIGTSLFERLLLSDGKPNRL